VLVVDGGSADATQVLARPLVDRLIAAPRGRAAQMNAGAGAARGQVLLFLHADTTLPPAADALIHAAIAAGAAWGRFDVRIDARHPLLRLVERMMNWRSRLSGIATGDQAIFVRHDIFTRLGGFPELPLDGGHRLLQTAEAHRAAGLPARAGAHFRAALGEARGVAHHRVDVASARELFSWRRPAAAGYPLWLCSTATLDHRASPCLRAHRRLVRQRRA
jgi:glycosyltransferase involved in cell wall biosynthesis